MNFLTKKSFKNIKLEYKKLIIENKNLINEIKKAKSYGDLSENAEYKSAKDKQKLINFKLKEIKKKLKFKIIKKKKINKNISFLNEIDLLNIENNEIKKFKIVDEDLANIKLGYISVNSKLAKILIGKSINDIIIIKKLKKNTYFKIIKIN